MVLFPDYTNPQNDVQEIGSCRWGSPGGQPVIYGMMSVTKPETFDERLREASAMSGKQESREEKNHQLYLKQVELLKLFLEKRAISKEQYDKSFHDLSEKMGYGDSTK